MQKRIVLLKSSQKVYRYILTHQEKELVELKTELHFINPYVFLLKKRFGGRIECFD